MRKECNSLRRSCRGAPCWKLRRTWRPTTWYRLVDPANQASDNSRAGLSFRCNRLRRQSPTALMPEDAAKLQHVVRGVSCTAVMVRSVSPRLKGRILRLQLSYFGERLAAMGVSRSRILVGTHPVTDGDRRVEIGLRRLRGAYPPCGDWSQTQLTPTAICRGPISAARCSRTSPPWSPIRVTWMSRGGSMMRRMRVRRADGHGSLREGRSHPG